MRRTARSGIARFLDARRVGGRGTAGILAQDLMDSLEIDVLAGPPMVPLP
jgi:hypothetical protein